MAWSNSKIFTSYITDLLTQQKDFDLASSAGAPSVDILKVALYNDNITPSNTATASATVYSAVGSPWATGNEVKDNSGWPAGGLQLATNRTVSLVGTNVVFDAPDLTSATNATTLVNVTGCLVWDDTIDDRGICYNWFGGSNTVLNGTFTIVWSGDGIISFIT